MERYKYALELNPDFRKAHRDLGLVYAEMGKLDDAMNEFGRAKGLSEDGRDLDSARAYAYARNGHVATAHRLLADLEPLGGEEAPGLRNRHGLRGHGGEGPGLRLAAAGMRRALGVAGRHCGRSPPGWHPPRSAFHRTLEAPPFDPRGGEIVTRPTPLHWSTMTRSQFMKRSLGPKTLICPTPTWIVGSYDTQRKPNVMAVAWGGICSSDPPCVAVSLRKATYSYGNLMARRAFTVSVPGQAQVKAGRLFWAGQRPEVDKFAATGLTAVPSDLVDAPFVAEFPLVLECKVLHVIELGLHTEFVGQILDVKADEEVLDAAGMPDLGKVLPIIFSPGNRAYYGVGPALGHAFAVGKEI